MAGESGARMTSLKPELICWEVRFKLAKAGLPVVGETREEEIVKRGEVRIWLFERAVKERRRRWR